AVQTQLDGLFPMDEVAYRTADPTGSYDVTIDAGQCTLANCGSINSMTITIPNKSSVTGDRTNGPLNFDGSSYVNTGNVDPADGPQCNGQPAPATYELTLHATEINQNNGAIFATQLAGTYTETVTSGDCNGQFRSFNLSMTKKA